MDEMRSTEFRRRYASITAPTEVTVNGHVIGTWVPTSSMSSLRRMEIARIADEGAVPVGPFQRASFTPVPKPSKKR